MHILLFDFVGSKMYQIRLVLNSCFFWFLLTSLSDSLLQQVSLSKVQPRWSLKDDHKSTQIQ